MSTNLLEGRPTGRHPKAPETMLELLLAAGVFEAATAGRSTWSIQPPGRQGPARSRQALGPGHSPRGNRSAPVALPQALEFKPAQASAQLQPQTPPSMPPPAPVKSGTQLSLIPPPEPPAESDETWHRSRKHPDHPAGTGDDTAVGDIRLHAPMRLNPVVRDALAEAIRTLNDGMGPPTVCTVAQGVFVPLEEFGGAASSHRSPCVPSPRRTAGEAKPQRFADAVA